jgi:hypothetical protein
MKACKALSDPRVRSIESDETASLTVRGVSGHYAPLNDQAYQLCNMVYIYV